MDHQQATISLTLLKAMDHQLPYLVSTIQSVFNSLEVKFIKDTLQASSVLSLEQLVTGKDS